MQQDGRGHTAAGQSRDPPVDHGLGRQDAEFIPQDRGTGRRGEFDDRHLPVIELYPVGAVEPAVGQFCLKSASDADAGTQQKVELVRGKVSLGQALHGLASGQ
ncbi:hypothetical protein AQJ91_35820 [Streptomyces dysideae]|uniref:Uncharacterized protein n=1 Tax=Streptomyces dysideae TaxID=909626 RepID=A0A117RYI7_9ACTN|nr:hypothetical protein AQJ91_35820 [Streptomyces dysideae]